MTKKRLVGTAACVGILTCFTFLACAHADVAEFYRGKTIPLVVGYPATSGYSIYARSLARHLGHHIPGQPVVIMQNMPGAASLNAANWIYNVGARDGSVIGMFSTAAAIDGLFGNSQAKFDARKFTWIGNMDQSIGTCAVWHTSNVKTFDDALNKEVLFGATGPAAGITQGALALKNLFGAKIRLAKGYGGGAEIVLAMEREEVQGQCAMPLSLLKTSLADKVRAGQIIPIIHDGLKPVASLPGVPSVYDYAKTDEDRQVLDLVFGWHELGRPVAAPPDLPRDRMDSLRTAFMATMADSEFVAEAQKMDLDISPLPGDQVAVLIQRFFGYSQSVVDRAADAVREK